MHSRDRLGGGWSAIIDPSEEGFGAEAEAKTDPQMSRTELKFPDNEKTTVDALDPVVRAKLQRPDDDDDPPLRAPKITKVKAEPAKKLRLPMPGENRPSKSGSTEAAASGPTARVSGPTEPAAPPVMFSSDQLVEKLSDGPAVPKARGRGDQSFWVEYKEVIRVAIIAIVAIAAVVAYKLLKTPEAQQPVFTDPTEQAQPKPPEEPKQPEQPKKEEPVVTPQPILQRPEPEQPTKPEEPIKAATPMVTVVSSPPGALVEINGDVHGKTPLIMRSPRNMQELQIKLQLDGFKKWEQSVAANDAGHFTVNAKLEPKR